MCKSSICRAYVTPFAVLLLFQHSLNQLIIFRTDAIFLLLLFVWIHSQWKAFIDFFLIQMFPVWAEADNIPLFFFPPLLFLPFLWFVPTSLKSDAIALVPDKTRSNFNNICPICNLSFLRKILWEKKNPLFQIHSAKYDLMIAAIIYPHLHPRSEQR